MDTEPPEGYTPEQWAEFAAAYDAAGYNAETLTREGLARFCVGGIAFGEEGFPTVCCPHCGGDFVAPTGDCDENGTCFSCESCPVGFTVGFHFHKGVTELRIYGPKQV